MVKHWWSSGVLAVVLALSARAGLAQDTSKEDEIQDLKRRLEALEKLQQDQQAREAATPGAAVVSDPVEEKWYDKVHVGGGVRTEYRAMEETIGTTKKWTSDFNLDNARLYTGGKINEVFSVTLDAEFAASPSVLDAICQAKIMNELNIWMGRMLPATDRSNSDGPFYISAWDFPFLSDGFNAAGKLADRDNGVTFWGDVSNFKYWAGIYEGADHGAPSVAIPTGDRLLYAARVQYNFLDPEPGYYLQSTYYGEKKILALGVVANYQSGAVLKPTGGVTAMGNVEVDFLFEEKISALADGTVTVEAAYYYFGRHGVPEPPAGGGPVGPFDVGAGTGFLFTACYLIPGKIGWGEFQPFFRYQGFDHSPSSANNPGGVDHSNYDFGVNYVMVGHNARVSLVYTHIDQGPAQHGQVVLGTQFQF